MLTFVVLNFIPCLPCFFIQDARDVGGKDISSMTVAMNIQGKETNSRLERSGFNIDTKEEEQSLLSSRALVSFSYDASSTPKGTQTY
jgi:hypothetical protein